MTLSEAKKILEDLNGEVKVKKHQRADGTLSEAWVSANWWLGTNMDSAVKLHRAVVAAMDDRSMVSLTTNPAGGFILVSVVRHFHDGDEGWPLDETEIVPCYIECPRVSDTGGEA